MVGLFLEFAERADGAVEHAVVRLDQLLVGFEVAHGLDHADHFGDGDDVRVFEKTLAHARVERLPGA